MIVRLANRREGKVLSPQVIGYRCYKAVGQCDSVFLLSELNDLFLGHDNCGTEEIVQVRMLDYAGELYFLFHGLLQTDSDGSDVTLLIVCYHFESAGSGRQGIW